MRVRLQAFAKINLDLRILAREESGYHQIETLFQRIALADDVDVRVHDGAGIHLVCEPPVDVPDAQNLAWRAAAAYRAAAHWPHDTQAISIAIAKRIPAGGGLGGGSADAGAVLRALNALNPAPLAPPTLFTLAATLGADVPFLTSEYACALAWGRGERMLALAPLPERPVHLATFRDGVNTAAAYRDLAAARADGRVVSHGAIMHSSAALGSWRDLAAYAGNDFEVPVFHARPDVARVHAAWHHAVPEALVRMSGSGATVFAIADESDATALQTAAAAWADEGTMRVVRTTTLTTVPAPAILSPPSGSR